MTPSLDPAHHFAALADWQPDDTGALTGQIPPSWMQGRAAFGGLPAAIGLNAARRLVPPERSPRAVHATLLAPLGPAPATATARVLRAGRALTQVEAELWQQGTLCARVTVAFGQPRPSRIAVPSPMAPAMPSPDSLPALPSLQGITPAFTQHFDYRFASRHFPFTGAPTARLAGWVRHRTAPGAGPGAVPAAILGLLDAWPAPVMLLANRPIPASTVTWTITYADVPQAIDPAAWWAFESDAVTAADGYSTLRGALYGPDGRLAALEEQLVAVFDG